jgi:hypothetical protein
MDLEFTKMRFRQRVFPVLEGHVDRRCEVNVIREGDNSYPLTVSWATSDMTATGVDKETYERCFTIPAIDRYGSCGDYMVSAGDLYFEAGITAKSFFVPLMDNGCYEHAMKYFRVALHVPGGGVLRGEQYEARVRIDDDDMLDDPC